MLSDWCARIPADATKYLYLYKGFRSQKKKINWTILDKSDCQIPQLRPFVSRLAKKKQPSFELTNMKTFWSILKGNRIFSIVNVL